MQKISSYLYPNVIKVVADVATFPVRWNIVYQNRIKIYQNIDNVLTIDVKNSEQKRIDVSSMDLKMCVTDVLGKEILTTDLTPSSTTGLATATITESDLTNLTPQFLSFSIYRVNDDLTKTILYADTQFGIKGNMELVGSALSVETPDRYITRFLPLTDNTTNPYTTTWTSDAVEIRKPNFLEDPTTETLDLVFYNDGLAGTITVQKTDDDIINASTEWTDIEEFDLASNVTTMSKTYSYPTYNRDASWLRVKYIKEENNTGNLDKVVVRL